MAGNEELELNMGKPKKERNGWSGNPQTLFGSR